MLCGSCGSSNAEGRSFCGQCGAALEVVCSVCGASNRADEKFCGGCGKSLSGRANSSLGSGVGSAGARSAAAQPQVESIASGRYRVRRILGEGGSKVVCLAHDERLDRDVAVALFRVEGLDDAGRARVLREARAMGRLGDHPHIVGIYDIGEAEQGRPYIVSQYVPGGSLSDLLGRAPGHRLPVGDTIRIAEQLCLGVEYAHSLGIVHRDIKPANVFLAGDGTPLLGDFGLAIAPDQSRITSHGMMVGTAAYLSPEQALGRALEPRSDLYSLGALIYELLTGRPPFIGDDLMAIVSQHVNAVPEPPSKHAPGISPALDALVLKLLAKTPAERPLSAALVRETLHTIAGSSRGAMDQMASTVMVERPNLSGHTAPDGTVSIMFSDIENSTAIIEKLGDLRAQEVFQIHNRAIREQIAKQGGYEVKSMGDGFMVAFSSARRALLCAVEIQQWLATYSKQHPDAPLRVRIGLNTGEALREAGDFFGKTVVLAARIGAAANGGQILVSATFKTMTESAGDIRFDGGRDLNLKGLSGSYRVFEVLWTVPGKADSVIELSPDRSAPPRRVPPPIPPAAGQARRREIERDRFVFGEVERPSPPDHRSRGTRRFDRRRRRLRIGLVVLLLLALSSGIDRWKRYRAENSRQETAAPGHAGKAILQQPQPESRPEASAAVEPAPPMVVKPNPSNQQKITAPERHSAPPPSLPRSKTTIISSVAPSKEESAIENAPTTGEAPPQCAPTPHRYNIEVSAVTEKSEADAMVGRIAELGYKACVKTTTVNGQTQYAVRIGPYNTADEAAAAQEKLHEQYEAAYSEP